MKSYKKFVYNLWDIEQTQVRRNGLKEINWMALPGTPLDGTDTLDNIISITNHLLTGLSRPVTGVCKLFVSNISLHYETIRQRLEQADIGLSVIGQPPSGNRQVGLWFYIVEGSGVSGYFDGPARLTIKTPAFIQHWYLEIIPDSPKPIPEATLTIFKRLNGFLGKCGLSLKDHLVRTWIYLNDIDRNYTGMANQRKQYFHQAGLKPETHYIASTGIGAAVMEGVTLDALAYSPLKSFKLVYLKAKEQLCPTIDYGVTFERGTVVELQDRNHIYISGTASIDLGGNTMHVGSVEQQTLRTLDNIRSLLKEAGTDFSSVVQAIVYLRNTADFNKVKPLLDKALSQICYIVVKGQVCRPEWLIEIECIAIQ